MSNGGTEIHTGYWVDHSKGVVIGGTLTYNTRAGSQLISAASFLVAIILEAAWAITAYYLHQRASSHDLQDEFDAQKRVLFRNAGSPFGAITSLWSLGSAWRGHARSPLRRAIGHMIIPFLIFMGFAAASICVGQIAKNPEESQVLLKAGNCGFLNASGGNAQQFYNTQQVVGNLTRVADSYARDCYSRSGANSVSCKTFLKPSLAYSIRTNASCPLGSGNCELGDNNAIDATTSSIDSHDDLGINAKPEHRLQLKYSMQCAPVKHTLIQNLSREDYSRGIRDGTNTTYPDIVFSTGKYITLGIESPNVWNFSTMVNSGFGQYVQYSITTVASLYPHDGLSGWFPIRPFNETTSDATLMIISANNMLYTGSNRDPIFGTRNSSMAGIYRPAHNFSAMYCTEKYQLCKNEGKDCTDWAPYLSMPGQASALDLNPEQNATWTRLYYTMGLTGIYLMALVPAPLRASEYVDGSVVSKGLPDGQWQREIEGWFQTILASLQYQTQLYSSYPEGMLSTTQNAAVWLDAPDSDALRSQCSSQRTQAPPGYTSYSVFGLVFIFVVSLISVVAAILLSKFGHKLPHRKPGEKNHHKLVARRAEGVFQLHRMALEDAGVGGWIGGKAPGMSIPYTEIATPRVPPPILEGEDDGRDWADAKLYGGEQISARQPGLPYYKRVAPTSGKPTSYSAGLSGDSDEAETLTFSNTIK